MSTGGLRALIDFVEFLKSEKIHFSISSKGFDSITVDFGLPKIRIEVDFYEKYMIFAFFLGDEDVSSDERVLSELFKKYGKINYPVKVVPKD